MCTLSWAPDHSGYTLCFNRDERLTRARAFPPAVRTSRGVRYIAPLDGDFGGTWIGVNQFGLSLALLNRYGDLVGSPPTEPLSRGLLIPELIDCVSRTELQSRSQVLGFERYSPFTLVGVEPGQPVTLLAWDGTASTFAEERRAGVAITSSAVDQPGADRARRAALEVLLVPGAVPNAPALTALHASHLPERGALSVCMHRNDAETQSFSRVQVTRSGIEFHHVPDAPCRGTPVPAVTLERSAPVVQVP